MSVLGNAACQKNWKRNDAAGIESNENKVRPRLRDNADGSCEENHQGRVVAYPTADIEMAQTEFHDEQYAESPAEYDRKMPFDDMFPKIFFDESVGSENYECQYYEAESREKILHPGFVEKIETARRCIRYSGMFMVENSDSQCRDEYDDAEEQDCTAYGHFP